MPTARIASGKTEPGVGWQAQGGDTIFIDVDTKTAEFTGTPTYVCSLAGTGAMYETAGGSSVYNGTSTGFRVYLRWEGWKRRGTDKGITPSDATTNKWQIHWIGYDEP
ncbi:hypothetical protein [Streptomyces tsukubensis]|uniref:hypothetical protein n=1 Tax=Streptomyces tsukubensis TaxID=83656 RepID=UPI00117C052F|nr:hypothetical protein [Streptomyces tsukubensis]QFR93407.1 hypothetical protein GBW32_10315 [Streptomyces tsukubensis]